MRTRFLLSLVTSAFLAAVGPLALAAPPAGATDDGVYYLRDARSMRCVAPDDGPLVRLDTCSDGTWWVLAHQGDGTVRLSAAHAPERCLAQAPLLVLPRAVWLDRCGGDSPDRWRLDGPDGLPSTLTLAGSAAGSLTARGEVVALGGDGFPEWIVQRVA